MPMTTRDAVESMLPPGTTVEDLNDRELGELFKAVIRQADGDDMNVSSGKANGPRAE